MPFPSFGLSRSGASRSHTASIAASVLAQRQSHAAEIRADNERKRAEYLAALADAGPEIDAPEVERAHRELARSTERIERAAEAVQIAEQEHAAAIERERRAAAAAQWDVLERAVSARADAAAKFAALAAELAQAAAECERAAADAYGAIPVTLRSGPHFSQFTVAASRDQLRAELERVGVLPDPRRAMGSPPAKPLMEVAAELHAMAQQARPAIDPA